MYYYFIILMGFSLLPFNVHAMTMDIKEALKNLELPSATSFDSVGCANIRKAYKKLALQWHPDRWAGNEDAEKEATEKFKAISNAYEALNNYCNLSLKDIADQLKQEISSIPTTVKDLNQLQQNQKIAEIIQNFFKNHTNKILINAEQFAQDSLFVVSNLSTLVRSASINALITYHLYQQLTTLGSTLSDTRQQVNVTAIATEILNYYQYYNLSIAINNATALRTVSLEDLEKIITTIRKDYTLSQGILYSDSIQNNLIYSRAFSKYALSMFTILNKVNPKEQFNPKTIALYISVIQILTRALATKQLAWQDLIGNLTSYIIAQTAYLLLHTKDLSQAKTLLDQIKILKLNASYSNLLLDESNKTLESLTSHNVTALASALKANFDPLSKQMTQGNATIGEALVYTAALLAQDAFSKKNYSEASSYIDQGDYFFRQASAHPHAEYMITLFPADSFIAIFRKVLDDLKTKIPPHHPEPKASTTTQPQQNLPPQQPPKKDVPISSKPTPPTQPQQNLPPQQAPKKEVPISNKPIPTSSPDALTKSFDGLEKSFSHLSATLQLQKK